MEIINTILLILENELWNSLLFVITFTDLQHFEKFFLFFRFVFSLISNCWFNPVILTNFQKNLMMASSWFGGHVLLTTGGRFWQLRCWWVYLSAALLTKLSWFTCINWELSHSARGRFDLICLRFLSIELEISGLAVFLTVVFSRIFWNDTRKELLELRKDT